MMTSKTIETTLGLNTQPSSKRWKKIAGVSLALVMIAAASFYTMKYTAKKKPIYATVPLNIQDLTTSVSATGNLEPTNTIDVGIEVSGTIDKVFVDYNDPVRSGQILARLDTTRLTAAATSSQALLMKSRANEQSAKAAVDNAVIEEERARTMYASTDGNYPSRKEMQTLSTTLIQAKASLAAAKAQVAQSYAQLKSDEDNLRKAVVVSPINGVVLNRKVEPGQTVVASMQTPILFTLAEDLTQMRAIVSVDEADIGGVKENQKVTFTVDSYANKQFEGKITQLRLNSAIVNGVVTYEAVVQVDNTDLLLRPGMTANASIITDTLRKVLVIPNAALRFTPPLDENQKKKKRAMEESDKGAHVWILKNETPTRVKVQIGKTDGVLSIVSPSSLKVGDLIITGIDEQP
ncbi:MAG: efflux transporter periplasmic adaptor subunit [Sulfuricurvum sp. 24-42-5]|nr:MAG: efflux transporter periplasmic adaptor subunit [Sulfuricurvum sp. 24-42-5]